MSFGSPSPSRRDEAIGREISAALPHILGLDAEPEPGPPWTHTFTSPEPIGELDDGTLIYPPPGPTHTLTVKGSDEE